MTLSPVTSDLRLVVGLGNPGKIYAGTRHNIGFMALKLAQREGSISSTSWLTAANVVGERLLVTPDLHERCGLSILALNWSVLNQLLVLVDDMVYPLVACGCGPGSVGGHNGLRSTIQHLGTELSPTSHRDRRSC